MKKFNFKLAKGVLAGRQLLRDIAEPPLKKIDYFMFLAAAIVCFFVFQNSDIIHTAASSVGYLNGHIFDFYDYNATLGINDSYMPSTYIVFAIWNLPLYIFGLLDVPRTDDITFGILMWNKLLPSILYMVSGWLMYKIAEEIGLGKQKSKLCAYAFLTAPIGFFSQFIFGQYDIFTVFFVLLGLYFWLKDRDVLFVLFFAISFTFKYFALLIFLPLLLIKHKHIGKVIGALVLSLVPILIEGLIYIGNHTFVEYVLGFSATGYVDDAGILTGMSSISVVIMFCCIIAACAYFKNVTLKEERIKWALYFITLMMLGIFGFCKWHPQWLLLMVPFLVLGAFIHSDTKIFMALDLLMMFFFVVIVVNKFQNAADEILFDKGILGNLIARYGECETTIANIIPFKDADFALSFYVALLLVMAVFKHPSFGLGNFKSCLQKGTMGIIRTRFIGGLAIFLIPAFLYLLAVVFPPYVTFCADEKYTDISGMIDREVTQVFIAKRGELERIEFVVGTYERENDVTLNVTVRDATTREVVFAKDIEMLDCEDGAWLSVDTENAKLVVGNTYRIDISCYDADDENCVTLYRTEDIGEYDHGYAIIGGDRMDYHLCVKIVENNLK
ncbi:MAG: DUF2029 domain-containing protein [Lachnospiraceae bacterium]|nr:DUF2029 domain-containing protein [Lachnospiraceae bacterium]